MISHSIFHYLDKYFWLGITDVVNGDWRWIYDQATPNYKFWYTGMPHSASNANSKDRNCAMMLNNYGGKWYDYPCSKTRLYICESNFCKLINLFCR
jgi:hypothetical protein